MHIYLFCPFRDFIVESLLFRLGVKMHLKCQKKFHANLLIVGNNIFPSLRRYKRGCMHSPTTDEGMRG